MPLKPPPPDELHVAPPIKLILNPSRLADYDYCKLLYNRKHNLLLDFPSPPLSPKNGQPLLGSLIHATQAAFDTGQDYKKAVDKALKELRKSIYYNVKYAPMVDKVAREALTVFRGGTVKDGKGKPHTWPSYPEWRENIAGMTTPEGDNSFRLSRAEVEVVDVEKRLWSNVGPVVLAPKLDAVIRAYNVFGQDEETWWVEEHKSTGRDDSGWRWRWEMDGQTTAQILAAEKHYNVRFEGILVNQVLVTRRRTDQPGLPPINKIVRYPARWVSKKEEVRTLFMNYLEDLVRDFEARAKSGNWTATGMLNRHCDLCSHRAVCSGRKSALTLQPIPPDELQIEFERRAKKAVRKVDSPKEAARKQRSRR